jgi:pRiA4b ORF-3-like protein
MQSARKPAAPKKAKAVKLFQFKITLRGSEPSIWRRIQVEDCTLDKLHEYIQTAMGWTNSHLHEFLIDGKRCGDPQLLADNGEKFEGIDSTRTKLSKIFPAAGGTLTFQYEYDFGDSWSHEIFFEGNPPPESGKKYPVCLEGARACPPEDIGGVWGYADFLKTIRKKRHKDRVEMLEWAGGGFDPEEFDPLTATKSMRKGLPDWRNSD